MEVPAPAPDARKRKDRDGAPARGRGPPERAPAPGDGGGNLLLAGLLAHEFLSSGTVLGERRAPESAAAAATGGAARYEAVAVMVQRGVARVPGVVNPAQLAAWAGR